MLGALLLVVIVLFVSCGGSGDDAKKNGSGNTNKTPTSQVRTPAPDESSADPEPSFTDARPGAGDGVPEGGALQSGAAQPPGGNPSVGSGATGSNSNVTAPTDGTCTDQEISAIPTPSAGTIQTGAPLRIAFKIKNISTRVCTRDLGAGAQELYLDQGARKYWSSDTCDADRGSNPVQMQPGGEYNYTRNWNGRQTSKCTGQDAAGPALPPGHYQLRGRVGTKLSDPVAVDITA